MIKPARGNVLTVRALMKSLNETKKRGKEEGSSVPDRGHLGGIKRAL
jgi:hypothetical protein